VNELFNVVSRSVPRTRGLRWNFSQEYHQVCASRLSRFIRDTGGVSAIEFALLMPVFVVLICGMITMGLYLGVAHSVQQLASDAARVSIAGLNEAERVQLAEAYVTQNAGSYALLRAGAVVAEAGHLGGSADRFEVRISYDASSLPIWQFAGLLPMPSETVKRTAVIWRGGY
jgi:Flp pilus assembly protein TadG